MLLEETKQGLQTRQLNVHYLTELYSEDLTVYSLAYSKPLSKGEK